MALIVFLIYTVIVFGIAWAAHYLGSQKSFLAEYFLGSRSLGMIGLALTFGATSASAGSFAGFPSLIYTHGWVLALWIASYMIFPLCGMGILGKRLNRLSRKTGAITLPELLRARFDSRVIAILSTALLALLLTVYLIPQFKLASLIMVQMLGGIPAFDAASAYTLSWMGGVIPGGESPEYFLCLLLFSVLVICYTAFGGFKAVVWTDILQGGVMILGVAVMLWLALSQVGGLERATNELKEMVPPRLGRVVFEAPAGVEGASIRIPADSWFVIEGDEDGPDAGPRLFRTNQPAIVLATIPAADAATPADIPSSASIAVVEIVGAAEKARLLSAFTGGRPPELPASVRPRIVELEPYAYGHASRGVYVTAPGPSATEPGGFLPLGLAVSFFVFWALSGTGQPGNMVRLMAFDSTRTLKRAIAALSTYFTMIYLPLVVVFCCARILAPGLDQTPDRIMPIMAVLLTETAGMAWLAGLIIAAPFAAAMSTVDSFMLMISSSFVRDIYQREIHPSAEEKTIKRLSYACTVGVGAVAALGAAYPPQFLQYIIVFSGGALASAFLGAVVLGMYWPRCNAAGACASMLGGFIVYLALYGVGFIQTGAPVPYALFGLDPLIWGVVSSLVCAYTGSLWTAAPDPGLTTRFFYAS